MAEKPKKRSNFVGFKKQSQESYAGDVDKDLERLFTYLDTFPRMFTQSAEPTLQRNTFGFWLDSDDSKQYLLLNIGGNQKKVELT